MITHFFSDPHFNHKNIIEYANRPFRDVVEMNEELIHRYRETVDETGVVLWTGDVSFGGAAWTRVLLGSLPGRKILVRGNHDPGVAACLNMGFEIVTEMLHLELAGHKVTACHYPPVRSTGDTRYLERRPPSPRKGEYVLHGHTHESERKIGRRIHVGVDAWDFRPARAEEVIDLIKLDYAKGKTGQG